MENKWTVLVGLLLLLVQSVTAQVPEELTIPPPTSQKDTTFLAVYNYNARYALTPLDLGRDIPQPDLISDLVVAYDTVMTLKTDGKAMDVVVTRSNTKISPHIKDKVAIIYLNDNCSPTQTCLNAQRAGAQAVILVHLRHKVQDIQIHTTERDTWRDSLKIPCYTVSKQIGEKMMSLLPSAVIVQKVKPKKEDELKDENQPIDSTLVAMLDKPIAAPVLVEKPLLVLESPLKEAAKEAIQTDNQLANRADSPTAMPTTPASLNKLQQVDGIRLYPNPTHDVAYIEYNFAESTDIRINVLNGFGQVVFTKILRGGSKGTLDINTLNWASAIYFIKAHSGKNLLRQKLVVQH
jgi:Secretion system C-terminal sorting domain